MKLKRFAGLTVALIVWHAGAAASAAYAVSDPPPPAPVRVALAAPSMTMDQAVKMAEERYHARVVKAETQRGDGHIVYVLRLLNESGRVWTVRVDAASGTVL